MRLLVARLSGFEEPSIVGEGSDHPLPDFDYGTLEIRDVSLLSLPGAGLRLKELPSLVPHEVLEVFGDGSRLRRGGVIPPPPYCK